MKLALSGKRVIGYGENLIPMGGTVIDTDTNKVYQNATIAECDGCPSDIDLVGYEYHAGNFVPCAPYGTEDSGGEIMVACDNCATPRKSGIDIQDVHDAGKLSRGTLSSDRLPTVPVAKGGTGRSTLTADSFLAGNSTGAVKLLTPTEVLTKIGAVPLSGGTMMGPLSLANLNTKIGAGIVGVNDDLYSATFGKGSYSNRTGTSKYVGNDVDILAYNRVKIDPALGIAYGGTGATTANAAANNLCEVGTWTPTMGWATNMETPVVTYTRQFGDYVRIGKIVTVSFQLFFTTASGWTTNGDYLRIYGLPYASNSVYFGSAGNQVVPSHTYSQNICFSTINNNSHMSVITPNCDVLKVTNNNIGNFYLSGAITYCINE